jgi:hypothetical protein
VRIRLGAAGNRVGGVGAREKPANLIYDVDEHPPLPIALVLALQHVAVSVGWIFVVRPKGTICRVRFTGPAG